MVGVSCILFTHLLSGGHLCASNSSACIQGHGEHLFMCPLPYFVKSSLAEVPRMGIWVRQVNFSICF